MLPKLSSVSVIATASLMVATSAAHAACPSPASYTCYYMDPAHATPQSARAICPLDGVSVVDNSFVGYGVPAPSTGAVQAALNSGLQVWVEMDIYAHQSVSAHAGNEAFTRYTLDLYEDGVTLTDTHSDELTTVGNTSGNQEQSHTWTRCRDITTGANVSAVDILLDVTLETSALCAGAGTAHGQLDVLYGPVLCVEN